MPRNKKPSSPNRDTLLAIKAGKVLLDGRHPVDDMASVMVTLDGLVALILITCMNNDPRKALGMLHEGLLPGVEQRIALFASKGYTHDQGG